MPTLPTFVRPRDRKALQSHHMACLSAILCTTHPTPSPQLSSPAPPSPAKAVSGLPELGWSCATLGGRWFGATASQGLWKDRFLGKPVGAPRLAGLPHQVDGAKSEQMPLLSIWPCGIRVPVHLTAEVEALLIATPIGINTIYI